MDTSIREAGAEIRRRTEFKPRLGLILGSGLGELAELIEAPDVIPTSELPGFAASTVQGHQGRLVFGELEGSPVVFLQGRTHLYEGHPLKRIVHPVRVFAALGVDRLLVTNAAGGIRPDFPPGTLMWITDHIDLSFESGAPSMVGTPSMAGGSADGSGDPGSSGSSPYDPDWQRRAESIATDLGIETVRGTYIWTRGPSYETPAEIRAFRYLGADAVGMSTVPEVREARRLGLRVLGLSTITNPAAGVGDEPLSHDEVLETGRMVRANLERLILRIVSELNCPN